MNVLISKKRIADCSYISMENLKGINFVFFNQFIPSKTVISLRCKELLGVKENKESNRNLKRNPKQETKIKLILMFKNPGRRRKRMKNSLRYKLAYRILHGDNSKMHFREMSSVTNICLFN